MVCVLCVATLAQVSAKEVVWNATPYYRLGHASTMGTWGLSNVQVRVTYQSQVKNIDTGTVVACGGSVPEGTRLSFEFVPHHFSDVYWVGTGYNSDSPYGDWVPGSALPAGDICIEKNLVSGPSKHTSSYYGTLSIAPPTKTITGLPSGCATASDGVSKVCTAAIGSIPAVFNFTPTTGKFYGTGGIFGGDGADKRGGPLYCSNAPQLTLQKQDTSTTCETSAGRCPHMWGGGHMYGGQSTCTERVVSGGHGWMKQYEHEKCTTAYTPSNINVEVPTQTISCPITVVPATGIPTPPTVGGNPPGSPASCTAETPYTITFRSTDPEGDTIRYGIDWDNNGSTDQFVPASGYVPSGTEQSATRTFATAGTKTVKVFTQDNGGNTSSRTTFTFGCAVPTTTTTVTTTTTTGTTTTPFNGGDDTGGGTAPLPSPDLSIRANPSLLRTNTGTKLNWSANNVTSCIVTGTTGESWNGITSMIGGQPTRAITSTETYTLTCQSAQGPASKSVRVSVIPTWEER